MRQVVSAAALVTALFAVTGCFEEPTPAYKTVPAECRLYWQGKGLKDTRALEAEVLAKFDAAKIADVDYLNLDRNQLTNVAEVAKLTGLKWLRLNENRLEALPDLSSLVKLRRLYLRGNRLASVPETIKDLPSLTDLDVSENSISVVPEWLAKKPALKNLSFSRTRITELPKDLSAWKCLQSLQLGDLRLSSDEMKRIRQALPDVAIVF